MAHALPNHPTHRPLSFATHAPASAEFSTHQALHIAVGGVQARKLAGKLGPGDDAVAVGVDERGGEDGVAALVVAEGLQRVRHVRDDLVLGDAAVAVQIQAGVKEAPVCGEQEAGRGRRVRNGRGGMEGSVEKGGARVRTGQGSGYGRTSTGGWATEKPTERE